MNYGMFCNDYVIEGWWLNAIKVVDNGRVIDKGCFRTNGRLSKCFSIKQGKRERCAVSPCLFNVFVGKCTENACVDGVYGEKMNIRMPLYINKTVLLAEK